MNMAWTDVVASVGAAAWLPQIISWIYKGVARPKLRFVPQDTVEIGYSSYGPILNQTFAISTSRKDALIERIEITVIHESGEKHELKWVFLSERGPEITSTTGDRAEFRKDQPAIGLKVSTLGLTEKKIGFQDMAYQKKLNSLVELSTEQVIHLEKTEGENYKQKAIKTKEFLDVLDFIKRGFYWKEGRYNASLYVYETSLRKSHVEYYGFELTKRHVEQLERNIKETQDWLTDSVLCRGVEAKELPHRVWNWVYPSFYRIK
jgi:hypothetical protein